MIVRKGPIKIVDNIFYYPASISDRWLQDDIMRSLIREGGNYDELIKHSGFIVVFAHGIPDKDLAALVDIHRDKKILFVYCGENIYSQNHYISKAFSLFNKLKVPNAITEGVLFNNISLELLNKRLSADNQHFRWLLENGQKYRFVLTNDLISEKPNVFFAPYFYFFSRAMMDRISEMSCEARRQSFLTRKFCAFVVSNPNNVDRIRLYKELSKYKQIDSYGKVFNNTRSKTQDGEKYLNILKHNYQIFEHYKFVICYENSYARGYITEKIVNAMAGGSIPIYRGDDRIGEYFDKKSIIDFYDYASIEEMVKEIIDIDQNEQKCLEYASRSFLKNNAFPAGYGDLSIRLNNFIQDYLKTR